MFIMLRLWLLGYINAAIKMRLHVRWIDHINKQQTYSSIKLGILCQYFVLLIKYSGQGKLKTKELNQSIPFDILSELSSLYVTKNFTVTSVHAVPTH